MPKFIMPVAMLVTQEQYKEDLKEPLKLLGYADPYSETFSGKKYLCTDWGNINEYYAFSDYCHSSRIKVHNYNPELFLAIAAMTSEKEPIIGEWLVYISTPFKVKKYNTLNSFSLGIISKETWRDAYRRATVQELLNYSWDTPNEEPVDIPKQFYIKCCNPNNSLKKEFTIDLFDQLHVWAGKNSEGISRGYINSYNALFDITLPHYFMFEMNSRGYSYGIDNNIWPRTTLELSISEVKKLINRKQSKSNQHGESKKDSREQSIPVTKPTTEQSTVTEQTYEALDNISTGEGREGIKIRTQCSRIICERGSIKTSTKDTRTRARSNTQRTSRGEIFI